MAVLGACVVPHPPLIIPQVGRGQEKKLEATAVAYAKAARRLAELCPDTVIVASPHSNACSDFFNISSGQSASGDFGLFDAGSVSISAEYDMEFVSALSRLCEESGFPAGTRSDRRPALDHGTLIPLYFLNRFCRNYKLVRVSVSCLSEQRHYELGKLIEKTAEKLSRRAVFIASGDMSHKLKKDAPYGFDAAGPEYDERICDVLSRAAFDELLGFDKSLCVKAAECGQRAFLMMAGALDGRPVAGEKLSYEAPFGVGYGVFSFKLTEDKSV